MRTCPNCKVEVDKSTDLVAPERRPVPGDFCICFYCFCILKFDDLLQLVICNEFPVEVALERARLRRIREAMRHRFN